MNGCVCVYTCMNTYVHVYVHIYMHACLHACMSVCLCVRVCLSLCPCLSERNDDTLPRTFKTQKTWRARKQGQKTKKTQRENKTKTKQKQRKNTEKTKEKQKRRKKRKKKAKTKQKKPKQGPYLESMVEQVFGHILEAMPARHVQRGLPKQVLGVLISAGRQQVTDRIFLFETCSYVQRRPLVPCDHVFGLTSGPWSCAYVHVLIIMCTCMRACMYICIYVYVCVEIRAYVCGMGHIHNVHLSAVHAIQFKFLLNDPVTDE